MLLSLGENERFGIALPAGICILVCDEIFSIWDLSKDFNVRRITNSGEKKKRGKFPLWITMDHYIVTQDLLIVQDKNRCHRN